jgi:fructokinase
MMRYRFTIVGLGEALFDIIDGEERLGGAPLNVALHAHQLAQPRSGRGVPVSRIGQDELGKTLIRQLRDRGLDTGYIQHDPDRPTGQVFVDTDAAGQPTYDIVRGAAWDMLWFDSDLEDLAMTCNAVAFGSLAQREAQTRNTIYRFLETCRRATRLFDVNLRPPFYETRSLRRSCELADVVKLNED